MKRLRGWFAGLAGWFFLLFNIERIHGTINVASFVYVFVALLAMSVIYLRRVRSFSDWWVYGLPLVLFPLLKTAFGYPLLGTHLPLTVTEICVIVVTLGLSRKVSAIIQSFEEAALDPLLVHFSGRSRSFEAAQGDLYREVRRARNYQRPLALLAVTATRQSLSLALNRVIEEVQKEAAERYLDARVADLLSREAKDCDLIVQHRRQCLVLLPETDREAALRLKQSIIARAEEELGLPVEIGLATFPDQEVTLTGLLARVEAELQGHASQASPGQDVGLTNEPLALPVAE